LPARAGAGERVAKAIEIRRRGEPRLDGDPGLEWWKRRREVAFIEAERSPRACRSERPPGEPSGQEQRSRVPEVAARRAPDGPESAAGHVGSLTSAASAWMNGETARRACADSRRPGTATVEIR